MKVYYFWAFNLATLPAFNLFCSFLNEQVRYIIKHEGWDTPKIFLFSVIYMLRISHFFLKGSFIQIFDLRHLLFKINLSLVHNKNNTKKSLFFSQQCTQTPTSTAPYSKCTEPIRNLFPLSSRIKPFHFCKYHSEFKGRRKQVDRKLFYKCTFKFATNAF